MNNLLNIAQIIIAALLIATILLQHKGSGIGGAFGGGSESYHTKRGFEKVLFRGSVVFGALFLILAFLNLFI